MSGHLLSTMNPGVSTEPVDPETLPNIGDFVIFVARPGEGRRGRTEFPALVMARSDVRGPTGLDLLVIYDAQDVIYKDSCQSLSEQQDSSAWKPRDNGLSALVMSIFGEWDEPPGGSIMDYLVMLDGRVKALEAASKAKDAKSK